MHRKFWPIALGALAFTALVFSSCSSESKNSTSSTSSAPTTQVPTTTSKTVGSSKSEWAATATATSSYGTGVGDWTPIKATGAPDITTCGDHGQAWASEKKNTIETITLTYATALVPLEIKVVETFNPGFVTKVAVSGSGQTATVYTAVAKANSACPFTLVIPVTNVTFAVDSVAVTVDQTSLKNWSEIDGVQLTGTPGN